MHLRKFAILIVVLCSISCGSTTTTSPSTSSTPSSTPPTTTPTPPTTPTSSSSMSAVIAGAQWNALTPFGVTYSANIGQLIVSGSDTANPTATSRGISFGVYFTGVGTYTTSDIRNSWVVTVGSQSWQAGSGSGGTATITITSFSAANHTVSGTFSFTGNPSGGGATGTKAVTNGTFTATF